jgi:carbonic anhydrase
MAAQGVRILDVADDEVHMSHFKRLCSSYLEWLAEDLDFQGVDDELATLPGVYSRSNRGVLLLAANGDDFVGTVALRPLRGKQVDGLLDIEGIAVEDICELKRLFVDPSSQQRGIGELLVRRVLDVAREYGYKAIVCDTLERLTTANRLYSRLGFQKCVAYSHCPLEGPLHFFLKL